MAPSICVILGLFVRIVTDILRDKWKIFIYVMADKLGISRIQLANAFCDHKIGY